MFENTDENGYIIGSVDENTTVINTQVVVVKANDSDITPNFKTVSLYAFSLSILYKLEIPTSSVIAILYYALRTITYLRVKPYRIVNI